MMIEKTTTTTTTNTSSRRTVCLRYRKWSSFLEQTTMRFYHPRRFYSTLFSLSYLFTLYSLLSLSLSYSVYLFTSSSSLMSSFTSSSSPVCVNTEETHTPRDLRVLRETRERDLWEREEKISPKQTTIKWVESGFLSHL